MLDWLEKVKGAINDSLAYDALKSNIEAMQRDNDSHKSHIEMLKSRIEILTANFAEKESQLDETRKRLAVVEAEYTRLCEDNTHLRERDKFRVLEGLAFKKSENGAEYQKEPYCPQCFRYINKKKNGIGYECPGCGYQTKTDWFISHLLDVLHGKKPLRTPEEEEMLRANNFPI